MTTLDETHDPARRSWVESANAAHTDFPIQNLPFGAFRRKGHDEPLRTGIAIGDQILDMRLARDTGLWSHPVAHLMRPLADADLNALMAMGPDARRALRAALSEALCADSVHAHLMVKALVPQSEAEMAVPCRIGDYTDFYAGIHHATAVGKMFRPDQPLMPNYKWVPIGYHGRASSIGVTGNDFVRPLGQTKGEGDAPTFGPCKRLDYELELGVFVGAGNKQGRPMSMAQAEADWFGMVLLNDWSARDIQAWEYQPLGPFLSKSFASTISPWIVTQEALAPFRAAFSRPEGDPQPLPHLDSASNRDAGAIDVKLEVLIETAAMRANGVAPYSLTRSNFKDAYWTVAQMLAHHSSNGCNLQAGDLLGSGTQSGPGAGEAGSMLELSMGGKQPLTLPNGEQRSFLHDGDRIILRAHAEREGAKRIGFGDCSATVLPAHV